MAELAEFVLFWGFLKSQQRREIQKLVKNCEKVTEILHYLAKNFTREST